MKLDGAYFQLLLIFVNTSKEKYLQKNIEVVN